MPGPHDTDEFKVLAAENESDVVIRKGRWNSLKEEFIDAMMTGKPVHWPTLSAKYGFQSQTARNKASTGKWYAEIETRRKAREDLLDKKLVERSEKALDVLNKDFATNEAAIRGRHALMARGLQSKAIGEIGKRDMSKASLSDLLRMVELGIREERFAMGLPEVAEAAPAGDEGSSNEFKPIQEQVGGHKNLQKLGSLLLNELRKARGGTLPQVQDVEPKPSDADRVYMAEDREEDEVQSTALEEAGLVGVGSATQVAKDAEVRTEDPGKVKPKITIKHASKKEPA